MSYRDRVAYYYGLAAQSDELKRGASPQDAEAEAIIVEYEKLNGPLPIAERAKAIVYARGVIAKREAQR